MAERDDIQAVWFRNTNETEWRLDSQRKEIERLRDEALARNAVIGTLQADKVALKEMLIRAQEYLEHIDGISGYDTAFIKRITDCLECIS